jgi:transposase InsO family protein
MAESKVPSTLTSERDQSHAERNLWALQPARYPAIPVSWAPVIRRRGERRIFHSDRGCQYTSAAYAALAEQNQVTLSVGRTGQCWDNALAESFFSSLKGELADTRAGPGPGGRSWSTSPGTTAPG